MKAESPRITARVDAETQELLLKAASLVGISSINSFVLNAAIEKAKEIIQKENSMELSQRDAMLLIDALDKPKANTRLTQAMKNYESRSQ